MKYLKKLLFLAVVLVLGFALVYELGISIPTFSLRTQNADSTILGAYNKKQSNIQVKGEGIVTKILRDDLRGSRHQRFIVKLSTGQKLLIAHNIDLAPRIERLQTGDVVAFHGEYEWNAKGGVIHWTHHAPNGRHIGGWLKHNGITYQ